LKAFILALILTALLLDAHAGTIGDPFTGTPIYINGIPGAVTIIEAENFDLGGEGVAFHDLHSCAAGCTQAYRPDGINVCVAGAIAFVSYCDPGLSGWVQYTVQFNSFGNYTVELLIAIAEGSAEAAYHVELDDKRYPDTGSYALGPAFTAGWTSFEWRGKSDLIGVVPGVHRLRIVVDHGWFNWDSIRVKYAAGIEWQQVPVWRVYP